VIRCPKCGETKPEEDFPRNRSSRTGRQAYCKPCWNSAVRDYKSKKHGSERSFLFKYRYGIDERRVRHYESGQLGLCAVCRNAPSQHVDHDHRTKAIRGLLCFTCNNALGKFDDDPDLIESAVRYLSASG
jgi:hypothetical protein